MSSSWQPVSDDRQSEVAGVQVIGWRQQLAAKMWGQGQQVTILWLAGSGDEWHAYSSQLLVDMWHVSNNNYSHFTSNGVFENHPNLKNYNYNKFKLCNKFGI